MSTVARAQTLEEFLELPETKPALEFVRGKIDQKLMPQGEHSRLQGKLCEVINQVVEPKKLAYAFPELRCTFGGNSIVPDVAVFRWDRIPRQASRRVANRFNSPPDWSIEILSPDQSQTKVLGHLLHGSENGTELGWLIDPEEESILVVFSEQRVRLLHGDASLPVLREVELGLTVKEVFSWLTF